MLLPLSYNHLASWIYYSFVFILRLLFINSWSQTFRLLKGFYLMYSAISFTCTSFVAAAFVLVFQKPTFFPFFFFFKLSLKNLSDACLAHSFHQSRSFHFTRDRICYFPGTCFAGTAILPSSYNLPVFQRQIFACSWTPNTECLLLIFISTMSFGQFGLGHEATQPHPTGLGCNLGLGDTHALPTAKETHQFSCHLHTSW